MFDASMRRVSDLIKDVEEQKLILKPPFQRRLVWTNIVKDHFLETVLKRLPFPEIFVATGEIDTKTMLRKNLLVDGQQRVSTLREYVQSSPTLVLKKVKPYSELTEKEKSEFLDYKVAVRDLGQVSAQEIQDIFERINSTDYALKAIERLNAQFSGAYKQFCENLATHRFFESHETFSMLDIRRMRDLDFCVILVTTILTTYYHRDELNLQFLRRYNDSFGQQKRVLDELDDTFTFVDQCEFGAHSRAWKKTDLFTLLVELHFLLITKKQKLDPTDVHDKLGRFYDAVDAMYKQQPLPPTSPLDFKDCFKYLKAATKATNDKYSRIARSQVIAKLLNRCKA